MTATAQIPVHPADLSAATDDLLSTRFQTVVELFSHEQSLLWTKVERLLWITSALGAVYAFAFQRGLNGLAVFGAAMHLFASCVVTLSMHASSTALLRIQSGAAEMDRIMAERLQVTPVIRLNSAPLRSSNLAVAMGTCLVAAGVAALALALLCADSLS